MGKLTPARGRLFGIGGRLATLVGRMLGRYRLEALLGRGGMAEVYRATDTKLARTVAVKVILPAHARDPHFIERFLREARLVASLEHPNILPVYDFGEDEGAVWLVMPYMDGGTLRDRMDGGPVPLAQAVAWVRQLAEGLDAAHAAGVLHRDVKPANVLVGRGERLALGDFGIAKILESGTRLTATGMVVGTPVYMAPEQAQGRPATPASDRYALAVLAYELLSGRPPFDGESALALMHQHVTTPAPALSTKVPGVPAGLDDVFRRALSKDPEERPSTCRALAGSLATYSGGRSEAGAPPTAQHTAATVLQPTRPPSVAVVTPPPSMASAATVAQSAGGTRRALALGGIAAALGLGALFVWSKSRPAAPETAPGAPSSSMAPAVVDTPIAAPEVRLIEKPGAEPSSSSVAPVAPRPPMAPARSPSVPGAPPEESDLVFEPTDGDPLAAAHRRLDTGRDGRRPSREDFAFALSAAEKVLAGAPRNPEARFLAAFAKAGLAYLDGRESDAASQLAAALFEGRKLGSREARRLWLMQRGEEGATEGSGWALALALGDPKRKAGELLERAIAERPSDPRPLLGRSLLERMDRKSEAAAADARAAYERASRPGIRSAAAELLGEELSRAGKKDEALSWLRRAVAEAPADVRARLAMRAARIARAKLSDEEAARELLGIACRSGSDEACREIGVESAGRPRLRPLRRLRGGA